MIFVQGDYKRILLTGLYEFDADAFQDTVGLYKELVETCPDAKRSTFNFQWESRYPKKSEQESALSAHDIRYWQ